MGIARSIARYLAVTSSRQGLADSTGARCLTLGRQFIHLSQPQLYELLAELNLAHVHEGTATLAEKTGRKILKLAEADRVLATLPERREMGEISDDMFFQSIGFDEVKSLDADDFEDADFIFDLNRTEILRVIGAPFDWVLDCGTLEHVFHVPNALRNIFDALEVGGHIIHYAPCNNLVDHGFYQFSPMFFFQYYTENGYEVSQCMLSRETSNTPFCEPVTLYDYTPGILSSYKFEGSDAFTYGALICAKKTERSTWDAIPQQLPYQERWRDGKRG